MVDDGGYGDCSRRFSIDASRPSEADDGDVSILVGGRWVNAGVDKASIIDIEDILPDSTPSSPSSSSPSLIAGDRKRKMAFSSKVPAKKRHLENNNVLSCPLDSVENSSSNLTEDEVTCLFKTANISSTDYGFLVPSKDQMANKPPEGYISVYAEQIAAGLRFPLHDLVVSVCNLIKVSPSQLVPNAHRMIVGYILCAKLYELPLTADSFFSLFYVSSFPIKGLFQFGRLKNKTFLSDRFSNCGPWKKKFFFLRRKDKSWNCLTKWSETFSKPPHNAVLAELAVNKGITDHHFSINKLTCKEILVHGGIEPGVPSPKLTFRYLMYRAAVTKFELPEEKALARATIRGETTHSTAPLSAPSNSDTSTAGAASPAQLSAKQLVNHQQSVPSPSHTKNPSSTEFPIHKDLSASSEDSVPLKDLFCEEKHDQAIEFFGARTKTKSTLPVSDEARSESLPPHLLTICQALESTYVPKERYQKLEKDSQELDLELAFTKSRVQELEQELELSEAKRADSEIKTYWAVEAVKVLEKRVEDNKSDSDGLCDKIRRDATEAIKNLEKMIENLKSESDKNHDKIAKDAIDAFKSSDEFLNAVQEEAATYYSDGFETCRLQFLNLGKLPKGFNFDFLDVSADGWGKSSGPVDEKCSKPQC